MSCLFRSIVASGSLRITENQLRKELVDYVKQNPHIFQAHIQAESNENVAEYCLRMSKQSTLGDYTMIVAACYKYTWHTIIRFPQTGREHRVEVYHQVTKTIGLTYTPGHYEPLILNQNQYSPALRFQSQTTTLS